MVPGRTDTAKRVPAFPSHDQIDRAANGAGGTRGCLERARRHRRVRVEVNRTGGRLGLRRHRHSQRGEPAGVARRRASGASSRRNPPNSGASRASWMAAMRSARSGCPAGVRCRLNAEWVRIAVPVTFPSPARHRRPLPWRPARERSQRHAPCARKRGLPGSGSSFPSQAGDPHIDHPVLSGSQPLAQLGKQRGPAHHFAGTACKHAHQRCLAAGKERNFAAAAAKFGSRRIVQGAAEAEYSPCCRGTGHCRCPGRMDRIQQQLLGLEGLAEVVVGANLEPGDRLSVSPSALSRSTEFPGCAESPLSDRDPIRREASRQEESDRSAASSGGYGPVPHPPLRSRGSQRS